MTDKPIDLELTDASTIAHVFNTHWGGAPIITRGEAYHITDVEGFGAYRDGNLIGLLSFAVKGSICEIVTLNTFPVDNETALALISRLAEFAREKKLKRLNLITTNDDYEGFGFYQRCGFILKRIYPEALVNIRALKSVVPEYGPSGLPVRDEIELELYL